MMNWIVNNKNIVLTSGRETFKANIKAVVGVGDCVNGTTGANDFANAQTAWSILSPELISVGTSEQLSTLYRLSLAEYFQTVIVLDDQLVQSDGSRMDWFRMLLTEKARSFQIVVVTCRPGDYLKASEFAPDGKTVHADSDGGFIRAIDLERAVRRK